MKLNPYIALTVPAVLLITAAVLNAFGEPNVGKDWSLPANQSDVSELHRIVSGRDGHGGLQHAIGVLFAKNIALEKRVDLLEKKVHRLTVASLLMHQKIGKQSHAADN